MNPRLTSEGPRRPFLAAGAFLLSAALLAISQDLRGMTWLALVGLVPACLVLDPTRPLRAWAGLAALYAVFALLTMPWLPRGGAGFWLVLAFSALYSVPFLFIPAACCGLLRPGRDPTAGLLLLPAGWTLAELAGRNALLGVSWGLLGLPLAECPALAQSAALGGPEAPSYLAAASSVALALAWRSRSPRTKALAAVQGPGLLLVAALWGMAQLGAGAGSGDRLRVALIQPNIDQEAKWDASRRRANLARYDALIDRALPLEPDLLVLPETALSGFVRFEDDLTDWARRTVIRTGRPLLFGSLDRDPAVGEVSNVAILITPYDTVTTYRKQRLVPVAEYLPWPLGFGSVRSGQDDDGARGFTAGRELTLFRLRDGTTFGTIICYEDIFPDLARALGRAGAEALIVLVNTRMFDDSSQPLQHLRRARLTAIAAGLPLARCTNSGISCVIDRRGRVTGAIRDDRGRDVLVDEFAVVPLPLGRVETPYGRFGDLAPVVALVALVLLAAALSRLPPGIRQRRSGHVLGEAANQGG